MAPWLLKAEFHYASWFGAGLKLVRTKFHYTSWFGAGSEQASLIEFGYYY